MLPLVPQKKVTNQLCHDVSPVIREIFQHALSSTPPPNVEVLSKPSETKEAGDCSSACLSEWKLTDVKEDEQIHKTEKKMQQERAAQLTAKRRINRYTLGALKKTEVAEVVEDTTPKLLTCDDLIPPSHLQINPDSTLWIRNIKETRRIQTSPSIDSLFRPAKPIQSHVSIDSQATTKSFSVGEAALPPPPPPPPRYHRPSAPPVLVRALPASIEFYSCRVGRTYTKTLRLMNVSRYETRLTLRAPARGELMVYTGSTGDGGGGGGSSARYAGGTTVVHFKFTPRDVKPFEDLFRVNVRGGAAIDVPIRCFMATPVLSLSLLHEDSDCDCSVTAKYCSCTQTDPQPQTAGSSSAQTLDLGAMFLGSVRKVESNLFCDSKYASFFIMTEEAWVDWDIDNVTQSGALLAEPFVICPTYFSGGGSVRGTIWATPDCSGLYSQGLRVISSTAVMRELDLLVDAIYFQRELIHVMAREKVFDILEQEDEKCDQFLDLGVNFPKGSLMNAVKIVNDSPIPYQYYWVVRPWGQCLCDEEDVLGPAEDNLSAVLDIIPANGFIPAISVVDVQVKIHNVGEVCGQKKAVLVFVVRDVPRKSFPPDSTLEIVSSRYIYEEIPGNKKYEYEVCDVVCGRVEVWWLVEPVQVLVQPRRVRIPHAQLKTELTIECRVKQITLARELQCRFRPVLGMRVRVPQDDFCAVGMHSAAMQVPLAPRLPSNAKIELIAGEGECKRHIEVERIPIRRLPHLESWTCWCGVLPPAERHQLEFVVRNKEVGEVNCEMVPHRRNDWKMFCGECGDLQCACGAVAPPRWNIESRGMQKVIYADSTPKETGLVLTLLQLRNHSKEDYPGQCALVGVYSQPPLVILTVLTDDERKQFKELGGCSLDASPYIARLSEVLTLGLWTWFVVRLNNITPVEAHFAWQPSIDEEDIFEIEFSPAEGILTRYESVEIKVRVRGMRASGRRVSVRSVAVRDSNNALSTPAHLIVEAAVEGVAITAEVPTRPDGSGRATIRRSTARPPLRERPSPPPPPSPPSCESQSAENFSTEWTSYEGEMHQELPPPSVPHLEHYEQAGEHVEEFLLPLISPESEAELRKEHYKYDDFPCIQFIQMSLRTVHERVIRLSNLSKLPTQWFARPMRFPRQPCRILKKDKWIDSCANAGVCVRCKPEGGVLPPLGATNLRVQVYADTWGAYYELVHIRAHVEVGTEGMEMAESLEMSVPVWVEAVGSPVQLAVENIHKYDSLPTLWFNQIECETEKRLLRLTNISRAPIRLYNYLVCAHQPEMDIFVTREKLPFRLLMRFEDDICQCPSKLSVKTCGSGYTYDGDDSDSNKEPRTAVKLILAPDYGHQYQRYYEVSPPSLEIASGEAATLEIVRGRRPRVHKLAEGPPPYPLETAESQSYISEESEKESCRFVSTSLVRVSFSQSKENKKHSEELQALLEHYAKPSCSIQHFGQEVREIAAIRTSPPVVLLMDIQPLCPLGASWTRCDGGTCALELREATRGGALNVLTELVNVQLCAATLTPGIDVRVRKKVRVQNSGSAGLQVQARCDRPWTLVKPWQSPDPSWALPEELVLSRTQTLNLYLPARASTEVRVELCARAEDVVPVTDPYQAQLLLSSNLSFFFQETLLKNVELQLSLDYPLLLAEPELLDMGTCVVGDPHKEFVSVTHTARVTLDATVTWMGSDEVRVHPLSVRMEPTQRAVIYLQYLPRQMSSIQGEVVITATRAAWCRTRVRVCAAPTLDRKYRAPPHSHDFTDDATLTSLKV